MTITHTYDPALWRLVPREPTRKMCLAYESISPPSPEYWDTWCRAEWAAMLAAAPLPPAPQTDDARMREFGKALTLALHLAMDHMVQRTVESANAGNAATDVVRTLYRAALQSQADATDAARMREALEEIVSPITFWRKQLRPDEILDGAMAVHLANDPQTYIDIAKKALAARGAK